LGGEIRAVFRQSQIQGVGQQNARLGGKETREKPVVHACFRFLTPTKNSLASFVLFLGIGGSFAGVKRKCRPF
jgi:hypothetical protein